MEKAIRKEIRRANYWIILLFFSFFLQKATKAESLNKVSLALRKETKHRLSRELMHLFVGEEETK